MEGGWENNIKKKEDLSMPSHDPNWQPPGNDGFPRESLDFSQDSPSVSKEQLWYGEHLTCQLHIAWKWDVPTTLFS